MILPIVVELPWIVQVSAVAVPVMAKKVAKIMMLMNCLDITSYLL